jgi:hypothetical protein
VHISIVSRFSRTVLADIDLTRTPHIAHDQGERAEFANGSAIARNRTLVKPAGNAAVLYGIAHLPPGKAMVEIHGLRSHLYDLSKCIAIRCKTQSFPASSPNFAYVRPVLMLAPLLLNSGYRKEPQQWCGQMRLQGDNAMDLMIWVPVTFLLGVGSMLVCYAFLIACENI